MERSKRIGGLSTLVAGLMLSGCNQEPERVHSIPEPGHTPRQVVAQEAPRNYEHTGPMQGGYLVVTRQNTEEGLRQALGVIEMRGTGQENEYGPVTKTHTLPHGGQYTDIMVNVPVNENGSIDVCAATKVATHLNEVAPAINPIDEGLGYLILEAQGYDNNGIIDQQILSPTNFRESAAEKIKTTYATEIVDAARKTGIDPHIITTIINNESAFSNAGAADNGPNAARGVMQIRPATAEMYGMDGERLEEPAYNILTGATILAAELEKYGTQEMAALSYHLGANGVARGFSDHGCDIGAILDTYSSDKAASGREYLRRFDNMMHGLGQAQEITTESAREMYMDRVVATANRRPTQIHTAP